MRNLRQWVSTIDWIFVASLATIFMSTVLLIRYVEPTSSPKPQDDVSFDSVPFDLHAPDRSYSLPADLKEISAVTISTSESIAWAVNDEQATLFRIDLDDGSVEAGQTFAKHGDYEGIELVGDTVVVARSDGILWRVSEDGSQKIESPLSGRCEVEGLAVAALPRTTHGRGAKA